MQWYQYHLSVHKVLKSYHKYNGDSPKIFLDCSNYTHVYGLVIDKPQRKHPARKITYLSSPPAKYWSSKHLHSCVLKSFSQTFPATQLVLRSSFCHNITSVRYDDIQPASQPTGPHNRTRGVALISASIKAEPNSSVFVATDTMSVGPSEPIARMTLFSLHRKSPYRYGGSLVWRRRRCRASFIGNGSCGLTGCFRGRSSGCRFW